MSADPSDDKPTTRSKRESHTRLATKASSLPWAELTEAMDLDVGMQLRGIVEILNAVHAKYRHGRPLVSSRAAWVLSLKRGVINREGEAELHSQPPPPPDASDDPWRALVAPEVQRGKRPDERSDIFVLGGMLFEALTGNRFESPEGAVKELEKSRTTARAAGLGGDYWEVELLAAAVRATREDPESRWSDAKQFADEIARIAAHRIKSKTALGSIVIGGSDAPEAPDSRKPTVRPPAEPAATTPAATKPAEAKPAEAKPPTDTKAADAKASAAKKDDVGPMQPAPVPKRSFTPAGIGVVSPPPGPAPATGLAPPLEKAAANRPEANAQPTQASAELSETGRKGTMVGLGVELPPPPAGREASASPGTGAASTDQELRVSATERKGTMVGLGMELPPPPPGHEAAAPSAAPTSQQPQLSATGRKGTIVGMGPELPPAPPGTASQPPVSSNQPGRFATQVGMGPALPPPPEADRQTPAPVTPNQPGRSATVQGLGPDSQIPIPEPPGDNTEWDLGLDLAQPKPKRRWGKWLLVAVVFVGVPVLVLRFGFRQQYDDLRAGSQRALGDVETNVRAVEAEPKTTPKKEDTEPVADAPEESTDEATGTAPEDGTPGENDTEGTATPEDESAVDANEAQGDDAVEAEASGSTSEEAKGEVASEPAPAPKPKPRPKPKRKKPKKKELKTPDYGI